MSSDPDRADSAVTPPLVPSGWMLERSISAWHQLRAEIANDDELVEDESVIAVALLKADAKDPRDLLAALIDADVWSQRRAEEARVLAAEMTERARRYEARDEKLRELIREVMIAIDVRKAAGRYARASIVRASPSVLVTDEQLIPDEYFKVERTLRKSDVLADLKVGVVIDGAVLSNGGETLRLARLK